MIQDAAQVAYEAVVLRSLAALHDLVDLEHEFFYLRLRFRLRAPLGKHCAGELAAEKLGAASLALIP